MLVYYFVPFIVSNRYLLLWVSNGHNSVTVQNRTHVYMNFFDHKGLGNHLLQLCPKVVKHPVYSTELLFVLAQFRSTLMYLSHLVTGFINLVATDLGLLHSHPFTNSNFHFLIAVKSANSWLLLGEPKQVIIREVWSLSKIKGRISSYHTRDLLQ